MRQLCFSTGKQLDPNFVIASRAMSALYGNLNQPERQAENARTASELREKVSERLYIEANCHWMVTGIWMTVAAYELWEQTYPRDFALPVQLTSI